MKAPIKLIIHKKSMGKDGSCIVYIQYCHSSTRRVLLNSQIRIPFSNWSENTQRVVGTLEERHGNTADINQRLRKMVRVVEDLVEIAANQTQLSAQ